MAIKITTLSRPVRERVEYWTQSSSVGDLVIARTGGKVCYLGLTASTVNALNDLHFRFPQAKLSPIDHQLDLFSVDHVAMFGTDFQLLVWQELTHINRGERITYAELAARVGKPTAIRSVASAVGANPISLIVPCHRVVRSDGSLGGYYWGMDLKRKILHDERH